MANHDTDEVTAWIDRADEASRLRDRDFCASAFASHASAVDRAAGPARRAAFLKGTLQALIGRNRPRIDSQPVPPAVKVLIEKEYRRIEKSIASADDAHFDLTHHDVRCDFRIVGFGRTPVGVHHVEIGGVPRRLLWSDGAGQAWRLATTLARAGGHAPFYVSHFSHGIKPWAFLLVYNPESQAAWHRNVAECLRLNPHVRGLLATSWWYDPQLAHVSPHLAFLREGSIAHGALLLRAGVTEGSTKYALAHSPERQQLFEAGRYRPVSHAVLWTRQALLDWADR